jgi:hypothetical protein
MRQAVELAVVQIANQARTELQGARKELDKPVGS